MSLAISSAIPKQLARYSAGGLTLSSDLEVEANRLRGVLQDFERSCRETTYALKVIYLADDLQGHARTAGKIDQWVGHVGAGFFSADSGFEAISDLLPDFIGQVIDWAERSVGLALVASVIRNGEYLNISLSWVKVFGLTPQGVRTFLGITATRIRYENLLKYWDKIIGKSALVLTIAIKWAQDFRDYSGTELASALIVDTLFAIVMVKIAAWVGGAVLGLLAGVSLPAIVIGAIAVVAAIGIAILLDSAFEGLGIRKWAIGAVDRAINWAKDEVEKLPERAQTATQYVDEMLFAPIARSISTNISDSSHDIDSVIQPHPTNTQDAIDVPAESDTDSPASPRLAQKLEEAIEHANVENTNRYRKDRQGYGETYCNIYVMDIARDLGIPLFGEAAKYGTPEAVDWNDDNQIDDYLDANEAVSWLRGDYEHGNLSADNQGPQNGWQPIDQTEAARLAADGHFVVAGWQNPGGIGHMAIIRPDSTSSDIRIAQAGSQNFSDGSLEQPGWPISEVEYFVHRPV